VAERGEPTRTCRHVCHADSIRFRTGYDNVRYATATSAPTMDERLARFASLVCGVL